MSLKTVFNDWNYTHMLMKAILPFVLVLALIGCSSDNKSADYAGPETSSQPVEHLDPYSSPLYPAQKNAPAPDFTTTLLNGETFQLSEQKGKVVMFNIWATWCPPCHEETPEFVELYSKFKDQGLLILGVSIDEQGKSVVDPFVKKYNVNYPIVIDDGTIMEKYGPTMGIPTSYIIDKQGNLRYFAVGPLTKKELLPRLKELLKEPT